MRWLSRHRYGWAGRLAAEARWRWSHGQFPSRGFGEGVTGAGSAVEQIQAETSYLPFDPGAVPALAAASGTLTAALGW